MYVHRIVPVNYEIFMFSCFAKEERKRKSEKRISVVKKRTKKIYIYCEKVRTVFFLYTFEKSPLEKNNRKKNHVHFLCLSVIVSSIYNEQCVQKGK